MIMNLAKLTEQDRNLLSDYETVIQQGLQSFFEVGTALMNIRDERLYRESHKTFGEYCKDRWGIEKAHAHRLIKGAVVSENVSLGRQKLPKLTSERQARELARLPDDQQSEAWQEAVETAPEGDISVAHVREVVARRLEQQQPDAIQADHGRIVEEEGEVDHFDEPDFSPSAGDLGKVCQGEPSRFDQIMKVIEGVVWNEIVGLNRTQRTVIAIYLEELAQQLKA